VNDELSRMCKETFMGLTGGTTRHLSGETEKSLEKCRSI